MKIDAIPSCVLDGDGRAHQCTRYERLAATVSRVERGPETIVVQFDERLDLDLLEEALGVERVCCPFFLFELDSSQRSLTIGVREPSQRPALEILARPFAQRRNWKR